MSEQRPEDQRLTDDTSREQADQESGLDQLNDAGAGAGADAEDSTFEPEEDA